uniref:Dual specificity protein phosphatase 14 n=2 Tax=Lygus hesperus TaxID=30085 RepID=A0A0K8SUG0_LYGHE
MVADSQPSSSTDNEHHNDSTKLFAIAEIEPWLYLCGAALVTASKLRALGITCVVSAAPELPRLPLPPEVTRHCVVSVRDHVASDLSPHLERVADLIQEVKNEGGKTLVHCVAGVSRSASLCLGYLVKYGGMSLAEAYHHVHSRRQCIRPNNSFFEQLISLEKRLTGSTTISMVYNLGARGIIPDVYESDYSATSRYLSRFIGAT